MSLIGIIASGGSGGTEPPLPYPLPREPRNAPLRTITPTYDGEGQALHPSVIDFYDIMPSHTWNGWRYWMAMTPLTWANDLYEQPHILVSQDGFTWQPPDGVRVPLYPHPTGQKGAWNYDPDLEYDPDEDKLWLTFNTSYMIGGVEHPYEWMVSSSDGVTWPTEPIPHVTADGTLSGGTAALIRRGPEDWWIMPGLYGTHRTGYRRATHPAGPWGPLHEFEQFPVSYWHWDVIWDSGAFRALVHDGGKRLYAGSWSGDDADAWTWNLTPVLTGSDVYGAWDSSGLYRSTMTPHQDGIHYRVWYTGSRRADATLPETRGVGYTWIPKALWPAP